MAGVTTAIVAFIFVGILFPRIIKIKAQFYGALAAILLVILLDAIAQMTAAGSGFRVVAYVIGAVLQVGAIFLLILSAGGLTVKDLAGDVSDAIEVMRRGDDKKTIIVPLTGQQPKPRAADDGVDDEEWMRVTTPPASSSAT